MKRKASTSMRTKGKRQRTYQPTVLYRNPFRNEKKYCDVQTSSYGSFNQSDPSATVLTVVSPGTDNVNRIGRVILQKSVYINYNIFTPHARALAAPANDLYEECVRIIVFIDHQSNGSIPVLSQLLQNHLSIVSPLNLDNRDRFKVLYDKRYQGGPTVNNANGPYQVGPPVYGVDSKYITLNQPVIYNGTSSLNIEGGAVYAFVLTSLNPATKQQAIVNWYSRVRFTDN